ncbi:unnamed protein product [Medioppia subpectinata]|uniref:Uncharacterized protein n=1 Tax=Medioppia subpectinata TaxID=1979941 RepID=A0A7R9KDE0_9ACAR|nr:unnamed protein product [Medioppia subpectinata]CAG2100198.1 unnamed protein product [Medioppia subpectinata]
MSSNDIKAYFEVKNSRDFTGKVVLVTGSSSGIGEGIVKLFAILGANVVVTGRNETEIQRVAKEVLELSPKKLKVIHSAVPHLEASKGVIINISSGAGVMASRGKLGYHCAKAGLNMLTRVLALQLAPKGVRVNTVSPGITKVPAMPAGREQVYEPYIPLRSVGYPLDIAKAVVFMASTDSQYITGDLMAVDGGFLLNVPNKPYD